MWNTLYRIAISIMLAGTLSCCIKNDIPFAKVPLSITGIEVEGQSGSAVISESESTVTVTLQETVNPKKVMLKTFTYTEKASSTLTAGTEIDLSQPYEVTLSLYQDYKWEIIGNQPIARRMIIDGQLGNSEFDVENHLATASIRKSADLKDIVLAIRYAVDHDADIIVLPEQNSLYPPVQKQWMMDVLSYAEDKGVLVIVPIGESSLDLSQHVFYPNRHMGDGKELNNLMIVGSSDKMGNPSMNSNYGVNVVDLYAPGIEIYSTFTGDIYQVGSGSILAAATTAGVAALVKAYYPQ